MISAHAAKLMNEMNQALAVSRFNRWERGSLMTIGDARVMRRGCAKRTADGS